MRQNKSTKSKNKLLQTVLTVAIALCMLAAKHFMDGEGALSGNGPFSDQSSVGMEVHFIDVGQGDATLIKADGHAMLIDAGENEKGIVIQNYLQKQGVEQLDYLILSHTDSDHIGGADVIISKFPINRIFLSDYKKDNKTYRDLMDSMKYKHYTFTTPKVGEEFQLGGATFTVIAPNAAYEDPNNTSLSLILDYGNRSFLFSGDCEEEAERDLLNNGIRLDVDVYQVGHHGSRSSSSEEFLDEMTPAYAVISCAEGNCYGHPHAQTLNYLRKRKIKVFRTDEQGSIIAYTDGKDLKWNCSPSDSWRPGEPSGNQ